MKRKSTIKNSEKKQLPRWVEPPFSRFIKVADLQSKHEHTFNISLDKEEKCNLKKFLDVNDICSFTCSLKLKKCGESWQLFGKINLVVIQLCIITLEKVRSKLRIPIKRFFFPEDMPTQPESSQLNLDLVDADPLTEVLDLGDIISEEIILLLPKYPRKKGVKLNNLAPPANQDVNPNPFQELKNLKIKLERLSSSKKMK